jgi:hypothetical protein
MKDWMDVEAHMLETVISLGNFDHPINDESFTRRVSDHIIRGRRVASGESWLIYRQHALPPPVSRLQAILTKET